MSDTSKIYIGEIIDLFVEIGVDCSSCIETVLIVRKPDGTELTWDATVADSYIDSTGEEIFSYTTGSFLTYTTLGTDFDQIGRYELQSKITTSENKVYLGSTDAFRVYNLFD